MATAATVGDVVVERVDDAFYIALPGVSRMPPGVGGFSTLRAAIDQARSIWNLRLLEQLNAEAGRLSLASKGTTDRLLRALDGLHSK